MQAESGPFFLSPNLPNPANNDAPALLTRITVFPPNSGLMCSAALNKANRSASRSNGETGWTPCQQR